MRYSPEFIGPHLTDETIPRDRSGCASPNTTAAGFSKAAGVQPGIDSAIHKFGAEGAAGGVVGPI